MNNSKLPLPKKEPLLEGSFGKEKEHYLLKKIKARTKPNEVLWHSYTNNALKIGRLQQQKAA